MASHWPTIPLCRVSRTIPIWKLHREAAPSEECAPYFDSWMPLGTMQQRCEHSSISREILCILRMHIRQLTSIIGCKMDRQMLMALSTAILNTPPTICGLHSHESLHPIETSSTASRSTYPSIYILCPSSSIFFTHFPHSCKIIQLHHVPSSSAPNFCPAVYLSSSHRHTTAGVVLVVNLLPNGSRPTSFSQEWWPWPG